VISSSARWRVSRTAMVSGLVLEVRRYGFLPPREWREPLPSLEGRGWGWVGLLADAPITKRPTHPRPLPFREGSRRGRVWRSVNGCQRPSEAFATPSILNGFCRRGGAWSSGAAPSSPPAVAKTKGRSWQQAPQRRSCSFSPPHTYAVDFAERWMPERARHDGKWTAIRTSRLGPPVWVPPTAGMTGAAPLPGREGLGVGRPVG